MDSSASDRNIQEIQASRASLKDLGTVMHWLGISLLAIFSIGILKVGFPIQLLQPDWQQKVSLALLNSGSSALIGAFFLIVSPLLVPADKALAERARLVRRWCLGVAVGYILLIPLQLYSGINLLRQEKQKQSDRLNRIVTAVKAIEKSTTSEELRRAIAEMPGIPKGFQLRADQDPGEARDRIVEALGVNINQARTRIEEINASQFQAWIGFSIANTLSLLMLFLGFAAIAQNSPGRSTLLASLFKKKRRTWRPTHS